jgi:aspartate/methionine/tyrosine aminotransferase
MPSLSSREPSFRGLPCYSPDAAPGAAITLSAAASSPTTPAPAASPTTKPAPKRERTTAPKATQTASKASAGTPKKTTGRPAPERQAHEAARVRLIELRDAACDEARPKMKAGVSPIRVMAGMVAQLDADCRAEDIPSDILAAEVVNRTIGDVDVRKISARDDGPEYVTLADEMGLALPGEVIGGHTTTGERYLWIREQMMHFERALLDRHFDLRIYDLPATGNPLLREMLVEHAQRHWGFSVPASQIYLSLGSLDGLHKFLSGYAFGRRQAERKATAVIFPAPGFNVPEWQAKSVGLRIARISTTPEDGFKVTPEQLRAALAADPEIGAFYLTVSSNPTAFAYTPAELAALFDVLVSADHEVLILADLAYVGTGDPDADRARMQAFNRPEVLARSVLFNSFSKTHTLTGDRCGWVAFGSPEVATRVGAGWANSIASLPADWQLRYMATVKLFAEHPEIEERIRALYRHRRGRLVRQLQRLNERHHVFAHINLDDGGTVYNWSQLMPGEDVFSLFGKTGLAGVPGSAFGYGDDFVRLSVGCIPVPEGE